MEEEQMAFQEVPWKHICPCKTELAVTRRQNYLLSTELEKAKQQIAVLKQDNDTMRETLSYAETNKSLMQRLASKLREASDYIIELQDKNNTIKQTLIDVRKSERAAIEELQLHEDRLQAKCCELQERYQSELEMIVEEKAKEFQQQLDSAEMDFKIGLKRKEKEWSDETYNQCSMLMKRHKEEVDKMNVEYDGLKNEIKALEEKLSDSEKKRIMLENLIQKELHRRTGMAERMQSVLKRQWKETMDVINSPSTGELTKNEESQNASNQSTSKEEIELSSSIGPTSSSSSIVTSSSSSSIGNFFEDKILPFTRQSAYSYKKIADTNSLRSSTFSLACNSQDIPFSREDIITRKPTNVGQDNMKVPITDKNGETAHLLS